MKTANLMTYLVFCLFTFALSCSNADTKGIAAECKTDADCKEQDQKCLTQFRGGYCGMKDCTADKNCPTNALCIKHTDNNNYCFRSCNEKVDCNANRSTANEANCSANVESVEGKKGIKSCVPPSSS